MKIVDQKNLLRIESKADQVVLYPKTFKDPNMKKGNYFHNLID